MRNWWARVASGRSDYGNWIPTPETDLDSAKFYLTHVRRYEGVILEWLQL